MKARIIDIREPFEVRSGYIEGSELVPLRVVGAAAGEWDRNQPITLVCRSGRRAEAARTQLLGRGFTNVSVLAGGVERWRSEGKPLVVPAGSEAGGSRWPVLVPVFGIIVCLLLARSVSPWFLLPVGFLAMRLVRSLFPGALPCCALPSQRKTLQK